MKPFVKEILMFWCGAASALVAAQIQFADVTQVLPFASSQAPAQDVADADTPDPAYDVQSVTRHALNDLNDVSVGQPLHGLLSLGSDKLNIFASLPAPGLYSDTTISTPRIPAPPLPLVQKVVTGRVVNVRVGPSTRHRVLFTVKSGDNLAVSYAKDGWSHVHIDTRSGWMSSDFLADKSAANVFRTIPTRKVAVPSSREVVRARKDIIRQSISAYPGACPCPYNLDGAGRRCGKRSAWSRPGGYSPLCYESDVTEQRIQTYFARRPLDR